MRPAYGLLIPLAIAGGVFLAPQAHAEGPCAHRSAEHAAQHHHTRESDSRWHVEHGQLPTCNLKQKDDFDDADQEPDDTRWGDDHHKKDEHKDDHESDKVQDHEHEHFEHHGHHADHHFGDDHHSGHHH